VSAMSRTWAQVACRGPREAEENRSQQANGVNLIPVVNVESKQSVSVPTVRQTQTKQERHMALLQEAMKSPQEVGSGARWCMGCGRRFFDVFKLAQHIKDAHGGVNSKERTRVEVEGPLLSDYMVVPPRKDSRQNVHVKQSTRLVHSREKDNSRGTRKNKKMTSLKKAYMREHMELARSTWNGVLEALEREGKQLESLKEDNREEIRWVIRNGAPGGQQSDDWSRLQVLHEKEHLISEALGRLDAMRQLSMEKIQHVELKYRRHCRKQEGKRLDRREAEVLLLANNVTQAHDDGTEFQLQTEPQPYVEHDDIIEYSNTSMDESSVDDDETSSMSSDDSFDLQWGDTLQSWAQNMGHSTLQQLSQQTKAHKLSHNKPIILAKEDYTKKSREDSSNSVLQPGAVRIISTANSRPTAPLTTNIVQSVSTTVLNDKTSDTKLDSWIDAEPFDPGGELKSCSVCHAGPMPARKWPAHLKSEAHSRAMKQAAERELEGKLSNCSISSVTTGGYLSVEPKCYTGEGASVERYVDHIITTEINATATSLLEKLIAWQERTRQMDPMNAKRKRRIVCGMREATKSVSLGKVKGIIVAPNIQPIKMSPNETTYPIDQIIQSCKSSQVPVIFALTRRKMGQLLGQRKTVSLFAILDVSGAEQDFNKLKTLVLHN